MKEPWAAGTSGLGGRGCWVLQAGGYALAHCDPTIALYSPVRGASETSQRGGGGTLPGRSHSQICCLGLQIHTATEGGAIEKQGSVYRKIPNRSTTDSVVVCGALTDVVRQSLASANSCVVLDRPGHTGPETTRSGHLMRRGHKVCDVSGGCAKEGPVPGGGGGYSASSKIRIYKFWRDKPLAISEKGANKSCRVGISCS